MLDLEPSPIWCAIRLRHDGSGQILRLLEPLSSVSPSIITYHRIIQTQNIPTLQSSIKASKSPYDTDPKPVSYDLLHLEEQKIIQIFLKTPASETTSVWVQTSNKVLQMKQNSMHNLGHPYHLQNLICGCRSLYLIVLQMKQNSMHNLGHPYHLQNLICGGRSLYLICGGRSLQNDRSLHEYNILPATTIILRLRSGAAGSSKSKGTRGIARFSLPKGTKPNQEHINVRNPLQKYPLRETNDYNKSRTNT